MLVFQTADRDILTVFQKKTVPFQLCDRFKINQYAPDAVAEKGIPQQDIRKIRLAHGEGVLTAVFQVNDDTAVKILRVGDVMKVETFPSVAAGNHNETLPFLHKRAAAVQRLRELFVAAGFEQVIEESTS